MARKIRKNVTITKKQDLELHRLAQEMQLSQSQIIGMLIDTLARESTNKNSTPRTYFVFSANGKDGKLTYKQVK